MSLLSPPGKQKYFVGNNYLLYLPNKTKLKMKAKDLIKALKLLDPEANVIINVKQHNKVYGVVQLPINYCDAYKDNKRAEPGKYDEYLHSWVNRQYGGSITVHLPGEAYIAKIPKTR